MSWFSIQGIKEEIRKIQWPKRNELVKNTGIVITFIAFFSVYFLLTEVLISQFLKLVKVF